MASQTTFKAARAKIEREFDVVVARAYRAASAQDRMRAYHASVRELAAQYGL